MIHMEHKLLDLDEIRRQIDIVQVINSYLPLTKKGKSHLGVCPFHDDSNPSLNVSSEKQIFKCFSCGAAGNVFTFIRDYEHIPFLDAVRKAADIAGVKVPELEKSNIAKTKKESINDPLYRVLEEITSYYAFQLKSAGGTYAMEYVMSRNLSMDSLSLFQVGFAPDDGTTSIRFLQSKGHSLDAIIASGIGVERDGIVYDRMRGRVVFPLQDEFGRVIGFSGRRLQEDLEQKYLNTPESPVFRKSQCLYHFHLAERVARRNGKIYVVEGFMDVISLHQVGIQNAVATMGTALTSEHITLLKKINSEVILCFDSDRAGQTATYRALDLLQDTSIRIQVVVARSDEKDIDEIIQVEGKESIVQFLSKTLAPLDFRLEYLASQSNLDNHDERKKLVAKASALIERTTIDDFDREHYIDVLAQKTGFGKDLIRKQLRLIRPHDNPIPDFRNQFQTQHQMRRIDRYEKAERQILHLMINDPLVAAKVQHESVFLYYEMYRKIMACILNEYNLHGEIILANALNDLSSEYRQELISIDEEDFPPVPLDELIRIIKEDFPKQLELGKLFDQLDQISDPKEQAKLAQKLIETKQAFAKKRRQMPTHPKEEQQ